MLTADKSNEKWPLCVLRKDGPSSTARENGEFDVFCIFACCHNAYGHEKEPSLALSVTVLRSGGWRLPSQRIKRSTVDFSHSGGQVVGCTSTKLRTKALRWDGNFPCKCTSRTRPKQSDFIGELAKMFDRTFRRLLLLTVVFFLVFEFRFPPDCWAFSLQQSFPFQRFVEKAKFDLHSVMNRH